MAAAGRAVDDERPDQAAVDAADAARDRQQAAELPDQVAHEDHRDRRRGADGVERRPQHRVVPGPVADRADDHDRVARAHDLRPPRAVPSDHAWRAPTATPADAARRRGGASAPRPSRGSSEHARDDGDATAPRAARSAAASGAGRRARPPSACPMTATATKFTELLIRKNATERRAIRSAGMPPRCRIQAPSARPPAPLAGTIEPTASSDQPISALVPPAASAGRRPGGT